jgi:uncharacterized protein (TIGR02246 family)
MTLRCLTAGLAAVLLASAAAVAAEGPADERAIRAAAEAYAAAFNKKDMTAFRGLWVETGEYVTETGERIRGRDALAKRIKEYLDTNPRDTLKITVQAIRFVTPDVAILDGTAEVSGPEGAPDVSPFVAVHVRQDGRWLLANVRDLTPTGDETPTPISARERLQALAWMVGDWRQASGGITVTASCKWDLGEQYLLWTYEVKGDDREAMTVAVRIGWDPLTRQFKSWVFDSAGGYAEGLWSRERDGTWFVRQLGVLPDGRTASATNRWTLLSQNAIRWRAIDRMVGAESLPDVDLRLTRVGPRPAAGTGSR